MLEPVMKFESNDQLSFYLDEWKKKLFLEDWIIKAILVSGEDIPDRMGECNVQYVNKTAFIKIRNSVDTPDDRIGKCCAEKTLIHELLHCKFIQIENCNSVESICWDTMQHQLIEDMAKSLLMAKYTLYPNWFKNINKNEDNGYVD